MFEPIQALDDDAQTDVPCERAVSPVAAVPPLPESCRSSPSGVNPRYGATEGDHFPSVMDHLVALPIEDLAALASRRGRVRTKSRVGQGAVELSAHSDPTLVM